MIPWCVCLRLHGSSVPRKRGDDPKEKTNFKEQTKCSLQARG